MSALLCEACAEAGTVAELPCPVHGNAAPSPNGAAPLGAEERSSWAPVDLGPILSGEVGDEPMLFHRSDGVGLFYAGRANQLIGEPESMKSWVAQAAVAVELLAGRRAVVLDFEDSAASVAGRLRALGVPDAVLVDRSRFAYVQPTEPIDHGAGQRDMLAAAEGASLVVLDGFDQCCVLHGWNPDRSDDVGKLFSFIVAPLVARGCTVLIIDHVTKARDERRGWARGSGNKKAQVRGASYSVSPGERLVRGGRGHAFLQVEKDTPGQVRPHSAGGKLAAVISFVSDGERITFTVTGGRTHHPVPSDKVSGRRPDLMERVCRFVEENPGCGTREIKAKVTGRARDVDAARLALVEEGWITARPKGNAIQHEVERVYREADDPLKLLEDELGAADIDVQED